MKTAVIIGGGFAGSFAAKKLQKSFNVVLIDTKDYFEFTPGVLRAIVKPEHIRKIEVKHNEYLKRAAIIKGRVNKISEKNVTIGNKKIVFDYLIISTGSFYNSPFKEQDVINISRLKHIKNLNNRLYKARKILIVGGGPVGVELAGEFLDSYRNLKKITLAHSGKELIEKTPEKAREYVKNYFRKKSVNILLDETIIKINNGDSYTNKGRKIKADLVFLCTGLKPNSELIKNSFPSLVDKNGFVTVNNYLQLNNLPNIFAIGDVNNVAQEKTAQNAQRQAKIAVKNILASENRKKLKEYNVKKTPMVISLGRFNGLFVNNYFVITGKIPALMKYLIEKFEMARRGNSIS